jgi:hypothetical protein
MSNQTEQSEKLNEKAKHKKNIYTNTPIQGVPGGMDKTSGGCSLC